MTYGNQCHLLCMCYVESVRDYILYGKEPVNRDIYLL